MYMKMACMFGPDWATIMYVVNEYWNATIMHVCSK